MGSELNETTNKLSFKSELDAREVAQEKIKEGASLSTPLTHCVNQLEGTKKWYTVFLDGIVNFGLFLTVLSFVCSAALAIFVRYLLERFIHFFRFILQCL